jgi:hypothetical protein
MEDLKSLLLDFSRPALLLFLASAIGSLTVRGRGSYHEPDERERLRAVNEEIHRVSGHLRDLIDAAEVFTESRAEGITESLRRLPNTWIDELINRSHKLSLP